MKPIILYHSRIAKLFDVTAITLYPFIFVAPRKSCCRKSTLRHELWHIHQMKRDGILTFYWRYWSQYRENRRYGMSRYDAYRCIDYEKEAYDKQYSYCHWEV